MTINLPTCNISGIEYTLHVEIHYHIGQYLANDLLEFFLIII